MPALLLALALGGPPIATADPLLLVPWELLDERRGAGEELRLELTVAAGGADRLLVAGDPEWRRRGAPSWVAVRPLRVRRRGDGSVASLEVVCDPSLAPPEERPPGSRCGRLTIDLPGLDAAAASRALARLTLGPEEDPLVDLAPHAAAILDGRLGEGALGLHPRLQAGLLWLLRPRDDWPRIALDTTAASPTLRVDLKLERPLEHPLPCWAARVVGARVLGLAGAVGEGLAEHGYALALDLRLLTPPEPDPVADPPDAAPGVGFDAGSLLAGPSESLAGLGMGGRAWDELRVRLGAAGLAAWSDGELSPAALRGALEVSWNGTPLPLPPAEACR